MNKIYIAANILALFLGGTMSQELKKPKIIEIALSRQNVPGYRSKRNLQGDEIYEYEVENFYNYQYLGTIYVGTHLQPVKMLFDTGSGWIWVPKSVYNSEQSDHFVETNKDQNIQYGVGYVSGKLAVDSFALTPDTKY